MPKKFNKRALAAIVAVIAVIALVGGSLAWFVTKSSLPQKLSVSGIQAQAEVYFQSAGKKVSAKGYTDADGLYTLSLDETAENYIGNLRVKVSLFGARACVRVRLSHEWTAADGTVGQYTLAVPYTFADNWYDNRDEDYCVYYQGADLSGKSDFKQTELIKGFDKTKMDTFGFDGGTSVRLLVEVDAVQINRYPQLWNIDKLPWK